MTVIDTVLSGTATRHLYLDAAVEPIRAANRAGILQGIVSVDAMGPAAHSSVTLSRGLGPSAQLQGSVHGPAEGDILPISRSRRDQL
jgi:hypothetical protein